MDVDDTAMTALKAVGWWVSALAERDLPAPQEIVGDLGPTIRAALVKHLSSGLRLVQCRGYSWCRFCCGIPDSSMGSCDLTDGAWVWPEGLAHYIEAHRVVLPQDFIDHVLSGPSLTKPDESQPYDEEYWIRWCAGRRVPEIEQGMRDARAKADAQLAIDKAQRINLLEGEQGLSNEKCAWAGCTRKALLGRSICAEHYAAATDTAHTNTSRYTALWKYLEQIAKQPHV
jgi:hypothetical protein